MFDVGSTHLAGCKVFWCLLSIPWFRALCNEISVVVLSRSCLLLHCQGPQDVVLHPVPWTDVIDSNGVFGAVDETSLVVGPRLTIRSGKYVFSHFFLVLMGEGPGKVGLITSFSCIPQTRHLTLSYLRHVTHVSLQLLHLRHTAQRPPELASTLYRPLEVVATL